LYKSAKNQGKLYNEIMPYHSPCRPKWEQLGMDYTLSSIPDADTAQKTA